MMKRMTHQRALGMLLVTLAMYGCGADADTTVGDETHTGGERTGPVVERGGQTVSARIGDTGGQLELESGARFEVAPSAITTSVEITLGIGSATSVFEGREDQHAIGPIVTIIPALDESSRRGGFILSVPFRGLPDGFSADDLALAIEVPDTEQRALEMGGTRTRWQFFPARAEGDRLVAELPAVVGLRLQFLAAR